jgi:hypothetical protein
MFLYPRLVVAEDARVSSAHALQSSAVGVIGKFRAATAFAKVAHQTIALS